MQSFLQRFPVQGKEKMNPIHDNDLAREEPDAEAGEPIRLAGATLGQYRHVCAFFTAPRRSIMRCFRSSRKGLSAGRRSSIWLTQDCERNMANENLKGLKVAILVDDGFEQVELVEPRKALDEAGAQTSIVSPKNERVRGWNFTDWGDELPVDLKLDRALPEDFESLLVPGDVINPDALRIQPKAVAFVKAFFDAGKPVASICHGPWTVIEAGAANRRRITSWPSLKTDLRNAGAEWVDREVVVDQGLVTSRSLDDMPAFNREMIGLFGRTRAKAELTA
jgi:protease I